MKAACLLPLVVLALSITGCSTINSRKQAHEAKVFPAVREHWNTGTGPIGKGDLALIAVGCRAADLAVAVSVDTLLLPYDLLHKQSAQLVQSPSEEPRP
ncbi:MAG: hypothetical protein JWM16_798 [Verrucomicrobiales bacterium]|nr:hypothetical protein [Verrucomicrobiales bacterium]